MVDSVMSRSYDIDSGQEYHVAAPILAIIYLGPFAEPRSSYKILLILVCSCNTNLGYIINEFIVTSRMCTMYSEGNVLTLSALKGKGGGFSEINSESIQKSPQIEY